MSSEAATDLCRVSLVTPRGRFDVALPSTVPLAYLLPTLLRQAGAELADAGVEHGGWALQRLGGWPFDTGQSAAALGIQDGEVLYLRPRRAELPPPVFDDVVEAIGWTLAERTKRWDAAATRLAGLVGAGVLLLAGAVVLLTAGPPWAPVAVAGGLVAVLLAAAGGGVSRALGNAAAGTVLGCGAVPYAFLAGLSGWAAATGAGAATSAHAGVFAGIGAVGGAGMLAGASAALVVLALAAAAVGGGEPVFLGAAVVTVVTFLAGIAAGFTTPAGTAAVAICLVFLLGPVLPPLAYRLARLPAPFLPATAEDLRRAGTTMPGAKLSERSLLADRYVTALLAGAAVVAVGGGPFVLHRSGWAGPVLLALVAALALLRTRLYTGRPQRVWLLVVALATGAEAVWGAAALVAERPARAGVAVLLALLALAAVSAAVRPERPPSPPRARVLDIADVVVAIATVPLVLSILGVYGYARTLVG